MYGEESVGSHLVVQLWKRRVDSMNDCLNKRGLIVGETRRMAYDRNEWQQFVKGNAWGMAEGMNPFEI